MRLHHTAVATFALLSIGAVRGVAFAESTPSHETSKAEQGVVSKPQKLASRYAPLFVEQKDAPAASKTTRSEPSLRFTQKLKD